MSGLRRKFVSDPRFGGLNCLLGTISVRDLFPRLLMICRFFNNLYQNLKFVSSIIRLYAYLFHVSQLWRQAAGLASGEGSESVAMDVVKNSATSTSVSWLGAVHSFCYSQFFFCEHIFMYGPVHHFLNMPWICHRLGKST